MVDALEDLRFLTFLKVDCGYARIAVMPDRRYAAIAPLMFHWTMYIGQMGDRVGYDDRYCFADQTVAEAALTEWEERGFEGEPLHWHRHPPTGRRRADADPEQETINW